jgi:membrane-associated protease RseP (regulator of RpoE activity)
MFLLAELVLFVLAHTLAAKGFRRSLVRDPLLWAAPRRQLVAVLLAGPALGYAVAAGLCVTQFAIFGEPTPTLFVEVMPGPAKDAGVRDGDRVVSVDGRPMSNWDDVPRTVGAAGNRVIELIVERDRQPITYRIQPKSNKIGLASKLGGTPSSLPTAIAKGVARSATIAGMQVYGVAMLIGGSDSVEFSWTEKGASGRSIQREELMLFVGGRLALQLPFALVVDMVLLALLRRRSRKWITV